MTVISLTSIPPRFDMLQRTLADLLKQTAEIREIRVNIPRSYRRFPEGSFSLPEVPEGVRIARTEEDYGPATKLLPALTELAGTDEPIIYCDDDRTTSVHWAQDLIEAARVYPGLCIANSGWDLDKLSFYLTREPDMSRRAVMLRSRYDLPYRGRRLWQKVNELCQGRSLPKPYRTWNFRREGLIDVMEGCGGVLIRPRFFTEQVFSVPEKVWTVDDIWLSGMVAMNGIGIWGHNGLMPNEIPGAEDEALSNSTIEGLDRQQANRECVQYMQREFGIWQTG
ncbi:hypothetical protein AB9K34_23695 [Sedimentitalea sp. XS_ASV28]|uniref:hypothetical protein n=1 Tax=Sedimentitalea sp. XS_ASV28 TaxID=3241296 RepID=UPI003515AF11